MECGILNSQCAASVHQRARAVVQVHQAGKSLLSFDWVPSHCGIAANELADAVAKYYAGCGARRLSLPAAVHQFWSHPLLSWTWALFDPTERPSLEDLMKPGYEPMDKVEPAHVAAVVAADTQRAEPKELPPALRLLSANVCSLRGKHQFIQRQLTECGIAICALQQTRTFSASALIADGWLRFGIARERGPLGVALWFRQDAFACGGVKATLESVAVLQQEGLVGRPLSV